MPQGWKDITEYRNNPAWKHGMPWSQHGQYVPTGEQECPDCFYRTHVNDIIGHHVCPVLIDGDGRQFTIGDKVYAIASGRIKRCRVVKYKRSTDKLSVEELDPDHPKVHVLNTTRKALKMEDDSGI